MLFADTDALSKLSAWDLYDEACRLLGAVPSEVCVLRAVKHQLRKDPRGRWSSRLTDAGRLRALHAAEVGQDGFPISEPDADLLLSLEQQDDAFRVDEGERALVAGLLFHEGSLLATGDKAALRALSSTPACTDLCGLLSGRVVHLEQIVLWLIGDLGFERVRAQIVPLRQCDEAMRAAFGSGKLATEANVRGYLERSIEELRQDTGRLLAVG